MLGTPPSLHPTQHGMVNMFEPNADDAESQSPQRNLREVQNRERGFPRDDFLVGFELAGIVFLALLTTYQTHRGDRFWFSVGGDRLAFEKLIIWCTWYTDFGGKLDIFWSYAG